MLSHNHNIMREQEKRVIRNVYQKRYDIPEDLRVRKADRDIRMAVRHSTALKRMESLVVKGIHPTLIFFENNMTERHIQHAIKSLHAEGKAE